MPKNIDSSNTPLESTYRQHHAQKSRYGFSYRVSERGPQFAQWIGTGKKILDIGCRDGELTSTYVQGNKVVGLDIDKEALSRMRKKLNIEAQWHDMNQEPLPFEGKYFDVVVMGELLEHLVSPQFAVDEAFRVLKSGGLLIGSIPNSFHWRGRLAFLGGKSIEDPTHLQLFSYQRIQDLLQRFADSEILPIGGIGGRFLPILPTALSNKLIGRLPALFANDFLFRAQK